MLYKLSATIGALVTRMRSETGQTMAEYGILIAVIAVIVIVAANLLGTSLSHLFGNTASKV
jgi:pilus assembly protein Flp/PilA